MKTIKQIADDIGVTKQAVFYQIKKPPLSNTLQPFISKVDGVLTVAFDGEKLIKQAFSDREPSKEPSKDLTVALQFILQSKEHEIERLEREVERLQERNDNLQEKNDALTAALIEATARRSFWQRLLPKR